MHRPQFQLLLEHLRDGDTVVYHAMDRLARNLRLLSLHFSTSGDYVQVYLFDAISCDQKAFSTRERR
jgi:hypothetical protein